MKKNFTQVKSLVLVALILIISFNTQVQGQSGQNGQSNAFNVSFLSIPILVSGSGYSVGSKYLFLDVAKNTNALVTILSATGGATVAILDDNTLTKPEAFSPAITVPANRNGLVEFKIEYVKANGNPKILDSLSVTAMDIDGSGSLHEVDVLDLGVGGIVSYVSNALQISVVQSGSQFTATNIGGIEYPGVDTSAKQVMFTVSNSLVKSFIYKAGANNGYGYAVTRQKGIYFKGFNYAVASPLPVKYLSFTGNAVNKAVVLNWVTAQETNNNYFEIERSFTGKDFASIGLALDGFENGTKKEYSFKDKASLLENKDVIYYRLKQFDNDGKFSYSSILVVRLKSINNIDIQVSPNPFTERLTVRFTATENTIADIRIVNISGESIINKKSNISKGFNNLQIEGLSNLPGGTYFANILVKGQIIGSQKIVK